MPVRMFEAEKIDNDLAAVDKIIREYFEFDMAERKDKNEET